MGRARCPVERSMAGAIAQSAVLRATRAGAFALACLFASPFALTTASGTALAAAEQAQSADAPRMVVEAKELVQDDNKDTVTARGNVQIYYKGRVLEADQVVYDRKTSRVRAAGHVKLTEADGQTIHAKEMELTDDLKHCLVRKQRQHAHRRAGTGRSGNQQGQRDQGRRQARPEPAITTAPTHSAPGPADTRRRTPRRPGRPA